MTWIVQDSTGETWYRCESRGEAEKACTEMNSLEEHQPFFITEIDWEKAIDER